MIASLKRIGVLVSDTLPWLNLAAFVALAAIALVAAMILIGAAIVQGH